MAESLGKKFEKKLKEDFLKMEGSTIDRLYDSTSGFVAVTNISDFIGYKFPIIYYIECKTHEGNSFPLRNLTQYEKLLTKKGIKGALAVVVIWFYEKDKVVGVPIEVVEELVNEGKKSISLKDEARFIHIESVKKKVFMDSDYSSLGEYVKERDNLNDNY